MIPKQLQKEGYRFIRVKSKDKKPIDLKWQKGNNFPYNDKELKKHFINGGNYGVLTGKNNLLVIDFDDKKYQEEMYEQLPRTMTVKTGSGGLHLYYTTDDSTSERKKGDKGESLVDLQGNECQVIGPGSTHPNGNKYELILDIPIAYIERSRLNTILGTGEKEEITSKTINKINCPFHQDKNASMQIYDEGNGFCFGCNASATKEALQKPEESIDRPNKRGGKHYYIKKEISNPFQLLEENYQQNVIKFHKIRPFFYDKAKIFWFWNEEEYKYEIVDEIDLMVDLDEKLCFYGKTVNTKLKQHYIEAFKRVGRMYQPNESKKHWIQFKDKAFSLKGHIHAVTPDYFFTNPIPWDIGKTSQTPTMDALFNDWVGEKYVKTLYEIIAYCCYADYPIQLLFSLCGSGRNGKSQYLKIIDKFIGRDNTVSTELDRLLSNRFESFKLYKKLVCIIGETNFSVLEQSSMLKKLTGGDKIGFEKKNKDPFDDYNYAKPIIASNSLPSSDDTSDGFYRRWLIIDFPNEFEESGHDIIDNIPIEEYNNLAKKVTEILPELLKRGKFTNQGNIQERREKYIKASNPLSIWLKEHCVIGDSKYVSYNKAYSSYVKFLSNHKKRRVKMKEFKAALEDEGFYTEKTTKKIEDQFVSGFWIIGINIDGGYDKNDNYDNIPTQISIRENEVKTQSQLSQLSQEHIFRYVNIHRNSETLKSDAYKLFGEAKINNMISEGLLIEDRSGHLRMGGL